MPKKIDDELKARAVRLVNDHRGEYSSLTAAAAVVAKQLGVGKELVRRWVIQPQAVLGRSPSVTRAARHGRVPVPWRAGRIDTAAQLVRRPPSTVGGERHL